ncbi:hypothetical protein RFI_27618 [Reticulomyxa filosa]|uniref:Uncharacterized protein n=1 Tax=Reticulomyxa filosa TaxID=46433 RepID=X6M8F5_RETFI|nr:hypothetical protein RFI_27618 [Reticulomyxa filosa]|eukprot:ETO09757.1 hypothetical protein RFI_27618 [Reticulomyxa filosa]
MTLSELCGTCFSGSFIGQQKKHMDGRGRTHSDYISLGDDLNETQGEICNPSLNLCPELLDNKDSKHPITDEAPRVHDRVSESGGSISSNAALENEGKSNPLWNDSELLLRITLLLLPILELTADIWTFFFYLSSHSTHGYNSDGNDTNKDVSRAALVSVAFLILYFRSIVVVALGTSNYQSVFLNSSDGVKNFIRMLPVLGYPIGEALRPDDDFECTHIYIYINIYINIYIYIYGKKKMNRWMELYLSMVVFRFDIVTPLIWCNVLLHYAPVLFELRGNRNKLFKLMESNDDSKVHLQLNLKTKIKQNLKKSNIFQKQLLWLLFAQVSLESVPQLILQSYVFLKYPFVYDEASHFAWFILSVLSSLLTILQCIALCFKESLYLHSVLSLHS